MFGVETPGEMPPGALLAPVVFFDLCLSAQIQQHLSAIEVDHWSTDIEQHFFTTIQQHLFATIEKC